MKVRGMSLYQTAPPHGTPTSLEQMRGEKHKNAGSGNLRAAVFGVNDGLISNASLILGVAGAGAGCRHDSAFRHCGLAGRRIFDGGGRICFDALATRIP
jgi:vacuolar iron transporter family protein